MLTLSVFSQGSSVVANALIAAEKNKNCRRGAQLFRTKPSLSHGVSVVRNRLSLGVAFVGRCVQHAHAEKMHSAGLRNFGSRDGDKDLFFSF